MSHEIVPLDGFEVVAVRGKGVWVRDGSGNYWHLGGPSEKDEAPHKLAEAYRSAVSD